MVVFPVGLAVASSVASFAISFLDIDLLAVGNHST